MYKLTPEQEQWLQALESGKYLQGEGRLCAIHHGGEKRYCCLGVAMELFKDKLGYLQRSNEYVHRGGAVQEYVKDLTAKLGDGDSAVIPEDLQLLLNLRYGVGVIKQADRMAGPDSLAIANDVFGWNFATIAKFIRDNPEKVFTNVEVNT